MEKCIDNISFFEAMKLVQDQKEIDYKYSILIYKNKTDKSLTTVTSNKSQ